MTKSNRVILHVDANSFYASVEMLYNPTLRNKPLAVGGSEEKRHGIILAKNDPAKKTGVRTGQSILEARQLCPGLIVLPPNYARYLHYSRKIKRIFARYTDLQESFGVDESWLDVTGSTGLFGSGEKIAQEIREAVKREAGLTCSIGVSFNKIFAKLGSDYKKPDAVTIINAENYQEIAWPLPVGELLYVGRATSLKLNAVGIRTIGDLAHAPVERLQKLLGKWGGYLWVYANGADHSPVSPTGWEDILKSVGNSQTAPRDLRNDADVWLLFSRLADSVAVRLRELGMKGRTVQISLRDKELVSFQRQGQLAQSTCLAEEITAKAMELFKSAYDWKKPLRSIGVRATNLTGLNAAEQLTIFGNEQERIRREKLARTTDQIRSRYGTKSIQKAAYLLDPALTGLDVDNDPRSVSFLRENPC